MKTKIKLFDSNGTEVPLEIMVFSGGEVKVRILGPIVAALKPISIEALLLNSQDVMTLMMLKNAVHNITGTPIDLKMPYVPYARQDRVCNEGEAFSLAVFADLINAMDFRTVTVYDPHSKVTTDLLRRVHVVPSYELIRQHVAVNDWIHESIRSGVPTYLVCPDKGAIERTNSVADHFSFWGVIYADKVRRPEDGKIMGIALSNPEDGAKIKDAKLLIVDDIADGGRTFIELAKVLQPFEPAEMNLYVTHGIFSQGKEVLLNKKSEVIFDDCYIVDHTGPFDNVWCTIDFTEYE